MTASLRTNRDFQLLWWGRALSLLGDNVLLVAIPLMVLQQPRGTVTWAGILLGAMTLSSVLVRVPAGALSDLWDTRKIMILCDTGCLLSVLGLAAMALFPAGPALLLGPAIALGALSSTFVPASTAAVKRLITSDQLSYAVGLSESRSAIIALIGFPLGGALYSLNSSLPLFFDAASYAGSILAAVSLRNLPGASGASGNGRRTQELLGGFRFLLNNGSLAAACAHAAVMNMIFSGLTLALAATVASETGKSAAGMASGWMMCTASAGTLIGSFISGWCCRRLSMRAISVLGSLTGGSLILLMAFATSPLALGFLLGAGCIFGPLESVAISTYQLRAAPASLVGRVTSAVTFVAMSISPLGPLTTGLLLGCLGYRTTFEIMGVLLGVLSLVAAYTFPRAPSLEPEGLLT